MVPKQILFNLHRVRFFTKPKYAHEYNHCKMLFLKESMKIILNFSDPFVKVYLMQNNRKVSKKKTTIKRGERNPIFNEAMIFSVPSTALSVNILSNIHVFLRIFL